MKMSHQAHVPVRRILYPEHMTETPITAWITFLGDPDTDLIHTVPYNGGTAGLFVGLEDYVSDCLRKDRRYNHGEVTFTDHRPTEYFHLDADVLIWEV